MLNAADFEEKLLRFVRDKLASPATAASITIDTRLFEDRVIDSLKILELIAFVQATIGRKIPDSQIVLANFRTISTIARVFTGKDEPEIKRPARRRRLGSATPRVEGVADLIARGEMELTSSGALRLSGAAASLYDYFDTTVQAWAADLGAIEQEYPDEIVLDTLEKAGFIAAFPDKIVRAGDRALAPAVCYHHYPSFAHQVANLSIVTALGRCHRNEFDPSSAHSEERLASFTMREIIGVGDPEFVERLRSDLLERVRIWVKELGLDGHITTASDPFFTSESRGRALMQQLLPLKYELRLRAGGDGRTIAVASFNNHHDHFGRAFSISLPSGEIANSSCVAFGWERWVIAFINQHGSNEDNWPEIARRRDVVAAL